MKAPQPPAEHYIVPARQLSGTRDDVLAQIDELILGLTGLRQLVSMHGPKPAEAPPRKLRLVRGFLKVLLLLGITLWASPVRGQTSAAAPTTPTPHQSNAAAVCLRYERLDDEGLFRGNTALVSEAWWFGNKQGAW